VYIRAKKKNKTQKQRLSAASHFTEATHLTVEILLGFTQVVQTIGQIACGGPGYFQFEID